MKVLFRADASIALGAGHVMRCVALADALRARGADCAFICAATDGDLLDQIEIRGYTAHALQGREYGDWSADAGASKVVANRMGPDWLVVDHYHLGIEWELCLRPAVGRILAIDDIGRPHCCDALLDQNLETRLHEQYKTTADSGAILLLGPAFALLRKEFSTLRPCSLARRSGRLERILVSMGGSDPDNETSKAVAGLAMTNRSDWSVDVVIGGQNPHSAAVEAACRKLPDARIHVQTSKMAQLMLSADCAINAGGSTTWERCCLGLPAVATTVSDDQVAIIEAVANAGAHIPLGKGIDLKPEDYAETISSLTPERLLAMSKSAARICDGLGAARVADRLH